MSIEVRKNANIDWMYPDIYGKDMPRNFLRIALYHVRAANDIEIEYNSERDGWVIYMTATTGYKESENALKPIEERREKAFIPAWDDDEAG